MEGFRPRSARAPVGENQNKGADSMNLNTASCLIPVERRLDCRQGHLSYLPGTLYRHIRRLRLLFTRR